MKTFKNLVDIIKTYIEGGNLSSFKLEQEEKNEMKNLLDEFAFLYAHSSDKSVYLAEKLKITFEDNLFFVDAFFENTSKHEALSSKVKTRLDEVGHCVEFDPANIKSLTRRYKYYQKENGFIEVYEGEQINDEALFIYYKKNNKGIVVPYIIKEEKVEQLIADGYAEKIDENKLKVFSTYNLIRVYDLIENKFEPTKDLMRNFDLTYVKDENMFVCEECYSDNYLKNWIDIGKNFVGPNFKIIDKNGNSLQTDEINYSQIIKKMRDAISHGNVFDLKMPVVSNFDLDVMSFILKSKTDAENKFKCAVVCLNSIISFLAYSCCISSSCEDGKYRFLVVPNLKSKMLNKEQVQDFLGKCFVVSIKLEQEFNEMVFLNYVNYLIGKYIEISDNSNKPNIKEYMDERVKKKFPNVTIEIEEISNLDLLNSKTINNPRFFKKQEQEQDSYVYDVLNNFYDAELLTKNGAHQNRVQLKTKGIKKMTEKINNILTILCVPKECKQKAGFYSFEYEMLLVLLVVYVCLIKNDITDEMNRNNKKPYLNELVKNTQNNSLEVKIADTNMSCFTFYDSNGDQTKRKPNFANEKLNVLKWIKNAVCHNGVFLKQPLAKNTDEQVLIFESVGQEGFSKNKTEKIHVVEVKYKDLMNYFLTPTFLEHKNDLNKIIKVETFDELMSKIKEINKT